METVDSGEARMIDMGEKPVTQRVAVADGWICMQPETLLLITEGRAGKGEGRCWASPESRDYGEEESLGP